MRAGEILVQQRQSPVQVKRRWASGLAEIQRQVRERGDDDDAVSTRQDRARAGRYVPSELEAVALGAHQPRVLEQRDVAQEDAVDLVGPWPWHLDSGGGDLERVWLDAQRSFDGGARSPYGQRHRSGARGGGARSEPERSPHGVAAACGLGETCALAAPRAAGERTLFELGGVGLDGPGGLPLG